MAVRVGEEADRAGVAERTAREWLAAMATGGIVEHRDGLFTLPSAHAFLLTGASHQDLTPLAPAATTTGGAAERIARAWDRSTWSPPSTSSTLPHPDGALPIHRTLRADGRLVYETAAPSALDEQVELPWVPLSYAAGDPMNALYVAVP